MRAIVITKAGDPSVLQLQERPQPIAGAGEVLVKVVAAGVNRPDVAQRKGHYPPPVGASKDIPGLEIAGIVTETGPSATRWKAGDKVCALLSGGGYAEYAAVPEGQCLPLPDGISLIEAASLPETFFTVWSNVFDRAKLKAGETFLVHGGSSGIGVTVIQMAKAAGAQVYTTAGSPEKCLFCEELGATKAINYKTHNFHSEIKNLTQPHGVDVILDMVGGDYTAHNIDLLAEDGRLVLINMMKGDETPIKLSQVLRKRLTITGSTLRPRDSAFKSAIARQLEKEVWPWLASGKIKPVVYTTFPLEQAAEAHRLMESSTHMGKIILTVNPS